MVNSELSEISYVIQAGVTTYPIGFKYHFNENNSPQLLVKIGESVAIINVDFQLSANESEIILIPTEEEARAQSGPNDTRWMDRIVGQELLITRDIPFIQTSDYSVGRINPEQIEYDFDRAVMRDQEILHQLSDFTVDVALAESLANAAVETANEAATAANQATATANTALETANTAIVTANAANATATQASQDAVDAMADAASAVNKADAADMTATTAMEIAAEASTLAQNTYSKSEVDNKITVINASIDANADAIQRTRADFIAADSDIRTILNNHAGELTTLHNDVDAVGDQVSGIEEKIPETASATNPLITKQQLLDEEMDIREDLNGGLSELQTQITAQAAEIVKKQDKLTAGENITIVDNVISATGGGGGGDYLPTTGGEMTGLLTLNGTTKAQASYVSVPILRIKAETEDGVTKLDSTIEVAPGGHLDMAGLHVGQTRSISACDNSQNLGSPTYRWLTVYAKYLNNGSNIGVSIPTENGTLARIEDIDAIGGVGTTGQVLTKTDEGMAWQDASGGGGGTSLPDQTDNAGKFLTTDGENASWSDKPLVNRGTGYKATAVMGSASGTYATSCGINANASAGWSAAFGYYSAALAKGSTGVGYQARAIAEYATQLGYGENGDANTFKVGNENGNFEMMDANGNIPLDRLTYVTDQIGDISTALTAILGE